MKTESQRRSNNMGRVLELLQQRGISGATNADLLGVGGFRYGARIFELRQDGWIIETTAGEGGLFRFVLKGRVQEQRPLFAEMQQ